ncbi:LPP20 family lipoprotein [Porticoccaceae bacterium]|nr:LPP20 family lipoprotein [Porticoccaceae bacterium]MDB9969405.1 LPP20 family lipoprotein [Porticoccaceae bacterium]MDC1453711.1 LPP20 family lipoprotein [Porticoccaceae bacterium]
MNHFVFRPFKIFILSSLVMLLASCSMTVDDYNAAVVQTMVGEKGNIVATGYAVISVQPHDNPAQQRLLSIRASKLDAYRSLMEQVYGQYLDANTTVGQMMVESDTFRARVQGVIYGAYLVSITPVGEDTYEVTMSLDRDIVNDLRVLYLDQMTTRSGA